MNFNTNLILLLFNVYCLHVNDVRYLLNLKFYYNHPYIAGYINAQNITNFLMQPQIKHTTILKCMSEFMFDLKFQVEQLPIVDFSLGCGNERTNAIFYNQTLKPNAWNLDFFAQPLDFNYSYFFSNVSLDLVELWILDTGVNWKHKEFEGIQVIDWDPAYTILNLTNPHGTGTAGCAGGKNYGSAKPLKIINYPVCRAGGSCYGSDIDKGLHIVLSRLQTYNSKCESSTNHNTSNCKWNKRIVVNLSVGNNAGLSPMNTSLGLYFHQLFKDINDYGGIIVNSAGNSNEDACKWFYSFSDYVISVGSVDQKQTFPFNVTKSSFSNWGKCVDIWSYGSNVPTAYSISDPNVVQFKSGTSFSSPLVAGLVFNLLKQKLNVNRYECLQYLIRPYQNFTVAKYECNALEKYCCQALTKGTRISNYCRTLPVNECNINRNCEILSCQ